MSVADPRPWLVIRQDANGSRYRVGHYATRAEAQRVAGRLAGAHQAPGSPEDRTDSPGSPEERTDSPEATDRTDSPETAPSRHESGEVRRYLVERLGQESGTHAS